ncbi:MAG: VCBS repeat-containing protein [Deltaproteobacteria bacterium]|nr:VCBS repeat-containing protein [Deltaproteobacteria bacterium]
MSSTLKTPRASWVPLAAVALLAAGCDRSFTAPQNNANPSDKLEALALPSEVAPGGVSLIDVSGGAPPYEVDVRPEDNKSGGANADSHSATHPTDGGSHIYFQYKAGPLGGKTDVVTVTDSDGGLVDVQVRVGDPLTISPELQQRAPLQKQSFAIRGGEAPYWVYIKSDNNDCAGSTTDAGPIDQLTTPDCVIVDGGQGSCIDSTGTLTVRSCGGGTDTITVYDQAGAKAEATVPVSEALQLQAAHPSTVPGGSVQLEAVGGVPPYIYSYAPRGNHSDGRVDVDGIFTAGPNPNVSDQLQVSDNVGASQTVSVEIQSPSVALPRGDTYQIVTGDFNGDSTQDVLAISQGENAIGQPLMVLVTGSGSGFTGSREFTLPFQQTQALVGDFNGDGTTDLLLTDTRNDTISFGLQLVSGRRDGSLDFLPEVSIPTNTVFSQLAEYDFSPEFGSGTTAYALSLTQLADGGVGQLTAITADASGKLSIATVMDIPQTGDGSNEQLIVAKDFQGFEQVLLAFAPQAGSGCTSQQLEVVALAFADSGDGGIARDPATDQHFCVPVPDPSSSTLTPVTFTNQTDFPDFVVSGNSGFPFSLALNDGNNQYQAVSFDGGGAYQDLLFSYDPVVRISYMGSTNVGVETEVQVIWPDTVDRWFFPQDGGPFSLRTDGLVGGFEDVTSTDFDGDSRLDEFAVLTDGGLLEFLRGGRDAHLATGHSRALQGYSNMVGMADLDHDGVDDVIVTDDYSVRVFWGDRTQPLAVGPQLDLGFNVDDIARGKTGGWVAVDDPGFSDNPQTRVQHISQDDGGLTQSEASQPLSGYTYLSSIDLGPQVGDAVLMLEFFDEPLSGQDVAPADTQATVVVNAGGRTTFVDDPLLFNSAIIAGVNIGSVDGGQDLVLGYADTLGDNGTLELHPFLPSDAGFWDPNASDVAEFDDSFLNPLVVTGVFPFASTPGGPLDRVLVAAGASDGQGGCQAVSSDTGEGSDAALYVYSVAGGHLTLLASGQYSQDFGDEPFDNFCDAQSLWRVRAVSLAGVTTLLIHDHHYAYDRNLDLAAAKTLWVDQFGIETGSLEIAPDTTDLATGDLNGDGLVDVVSTTFETEFQFSLTHADGTLY